MSKLNVFILELEKATISLLKLAKECAYNNISDNCFYIISEIPKQEMDTETARKLRNVQNRAKQPVELTKLNKKLELLYPLTHDFNLFIYEARKDQTIIDIRHFPRTFLELDYQRQLADVPPMLNAKVPLPPYHIDGEKIDINWESGNIRHQWNMLKLKLKLRIAR